MKFPPASANASKILRLSSFEAPHPHSSPKLMAPRESSDTLRPLLPSSLYRMLVRCSPRGSDARRRAAGVLRLHPLFLKNFALEANDDEADGDIELACPQRLDR